MWVDARPYLGSSALLDQAVARARVAVSPGEDFGKEYGGFFRINVALPQRDLERALDRLCQAILALSTH